MLATQTNISHLKTSFVILGEAKNLGTYSTQSLFASVQRDRYTESVHARSGQ